MSRQALDVALINPGSRTMVYQALGSSLAAIEPPVWAGLMATFLRRRGVSVSIIDAEADELTPEQTAAQALAQDPRLLAVVVYGHQPSASTQNMTAAGAICTAVKHEAPEMKVLLVGGHAAALPERTLREEDADFVCGGEGPYTLLELVQALQSGAAPDYTKIRGLWYWEGDTARSNPAAPLVKDLDGDMPEIAWDLLPMGKYRAHNWHGFGDLKRQPYAALYTTLGCPYHCSFCLRKGTTIITAEGRNKKIEDVRVGDVVMAWDEQAGKLSESIVVATGSRWVDRLLRIQMHTGETIEVTDEHPIYTPQGWVEAGQLQAGQSILVMEQRDKVTYVRSVHNPAKRPEVRAVLSQRPLDAGHGLWPWALALGRPERGEAESRDDEVGATGSARGDPRQEQNPATRPDVRAKISATLKRKIRKRDGNTCQHCGRQDALTVHHIDYNKANCDPCNLITLCVSCNSKANANREQWEASFKDKMARIGNCPRFVAIEAIEEVRGTFQVFNFQCSPHDNYFAERLLVHNCCIQAPFKSGEKELGYKESVNSYRFWSPKAVLAQIDHLVNRYGVRNVKIADEMFVLNPKHIHGICDLLIERGYDLNIWAYARVDTVREDMVEKLRRAGFTWLAFGIEAASERVRADVQKGFGQDEIFKTIQRVRAAGINVIANYIFGLPEDDLETMQATLDLALELNCEFANVYSAMAYPGSALYELALKEGRPLPERWSGYSQHAIDALPLPTKYISGAEVLRFRDRAFQVYFNSPRYLEMVERKFGPETVAHIREMTSHKLVRQYA